MIGINRGKLRYVSPRCAALVQIVHGYGDKDNARANSSALSVYLHQLPRGPLHPDISQAACTELDPPAGWMMCIEGVRCFTDLMPVIQGLSAH